jgi:hypothetical protein
MLKKTTKTRAFTPSTLFVIHKLWGSRCLQYVIGRPEMIREDPCGKLRPRPKDNIKVGYMRARTEIHLAQDRVK